MTGKRSIDGDNVIYHYFRDEFIGKETERDRLLIRRMLHDLAIWLPIRLYQTIPVLLPFVIRDPSCRKSVNKKREEWGSCDSNGFFRDDNTLVKAIPRRFTIMSGNRIYSRRRMAKGFVASHVWRRLSDKSGLASRNPMTNTFVPNLVWLPRQLSKLTDREGSFAQKYLQALSVSIFKGVELAGAKSKLVGTIWKMLEPPTVKIDENEKEELNFFDMSQRDIQKSLSGLLAKFDIIRNPSGGKVYCSRYLKTFVNLSQEKRALLTSKVSRYAQMIT